MTLKKQPLRDKTSIDEEESIIAALLYIESELRYLDMPLTEEKLKNTIKTALKEIISKEIEYKFLDEDTRKIKKCLENALTHQGTDLEKFIKFFDCYKQNKESARTMNS